MASDDFLCDQLSVMVIGAISGDVKYHSTAARLLWGLEHVASVPGGHPPLHVPTGWSAETWAATLEQRYSFFSSFLPAVLTRTLVDGLQEQLSQGVAEPNAWGLALLPAVQGASHPMSPTAGEPGPAVAPSATGQLATQTHPQLQPIAPMSESQGQGRRQQNVGQTPEVAHSSHINNHSTPAASLRSPPPSSNLQPPQPHQHRRRLLPPRSPTQADTRECELDQDRVAAYFMADALMLRTSTRPLRQRRPPAIARSSSGGEGLLDSDLCFLLARAASLNRSSGSTSSRGVFNNAASRADWCTQAPVPAGASNAAAAATGAAASSGIDVGPRRSPVATALRGSADGATTATTRRRRHIRPSAGGWMPRPPSQSAFLSMPEDASHGSHGLEGMQAAESKESSPWWEMVPAGPDAVPATSAAPDASPPLALLLSPQLPAAQPVSSSSPAGGRAFESLGQSVPMLEGHRAMRDLVGLGGSGADSPRGPVVSAGGRCAGVKPERGAEGQEAAPKPAGLVMRDDVSYEGERMEMLAHLRGLLGAADSQPAGGPPPPPPPPGDQLQQEQDQRGHSKVLMQQEGEQPQQEGEQPQLPEVEVVAEVGTAEGSEVQAQAKAATISPPIGMDMSPFTHPQAAAAEEHHQLQQEFLAGTSGGEEYVQEPLPAPRQPHRRSAGGGRRIDGSARGPPGVTTSGSIKRHVRRLSTRNRLQALLQAYDPIWHSHPQLPARTTNTGSEGLGLASSSRMGAPGRGGPSGSGSSSSNRDEPRRGGNSASGAAASKEALRGSAGDGVLGDGERSGAPESKGQAPEVEGEGECVREGRWYQVRLRLIMPRRPHRPHADSASPGAALGADGAKAARGESPLSEGWSEPVLLLVAEDVNELVRCAEAVEQELWAAQQRNDLLETVLADLYKVLEAVFPRQAIEYMTRLMASRSTNTTGQSNTPSQPAVPSSPRLFSMTQFLTASSVICPTAPAGEPTAHPPSPGAELRAPDQSQQQLLDVPGGGADGTRQLQQRASYANTAPAAGGPAVDSDGTRRLLKPVSVRSRTVLAAVAVAAGSVAGALGDEQVTMAAPSGPEDPCRIGTIQEPGGSVTVDPQQPRGRTTYSGTAPASLGPGLGPRLVPTLAHGPFHRSLAACPAPASTWGLPPAGVQQNAAVPLATAHSNVTVLFADICGFTSMCNSLQPMQVMAFLNGLFTRLDSLCDIYGVYKVETIGDCFMAVGGLIKVDAEGFKSVLPDGCEDELHALKVMSFAKALLRDVCNVTMPHTGEPLSMRVGLHSGPVTAGIVGAKMPRFCLFGDTVNTASRMESSCEPGCIHVSAATRQLLQDEQWVPTGGLEVKGKGQMETFLWRPPPGFTAAKGGFSASMAAPGYWDDNGGGGAGGGPSRLSEDPTSMPSREARAAVFAVSDSEEVRRQAVLLRQVGRMRDTHREVLPDARLDEGADGGLGLGEGN